MMNTLVWVTKYFSSSFVVNSNVCALVSFVFYFVFVTARYKVGVKYMDLLLFF
jgi:hypothetical protein